MDKRYVVPTILVILVSLLAIHPAAADAFFGWSPWGGWGGGSSSSITVTATTPHYLWRASGATANVRIHVHVSCTGSEIKKITVTVDGSDWRTYYKPWWMWFSKWTTFDRTITLKLKPGDHFITVSAVDNAGDYDCDFVSVRVLSPPPPHINIIARKYVTVNDGDHWSGTITIHATAQAGITNIEYYVNNVYQGSWSPSWWSGNPRSKDWHVHVDLYPGWNKISADVTDKAGHTAFATFYVHVGVVKPTLSMSLPSSGVISNDGHWHGTLHFSARDSAGLDHVSIYIDGCLVKTYNKPFWAWHWTSCVKDYTLSLGTGDHTIRVVAVGGGTSASCSKDIYIYRPSPPKITLTAPPSARVNSPDKTWKGTIIATARDSYGINSVKIYIDGKLTCTASGSGLFGIGGLKKTVSAKADVSLKIGTHTIKVIADGYGHVDSITSAKIEILPAAPPTVTISSLPKRVILKNGQKQWSQEISAQAKSTIGLDYLTLTINGKTVATAKGNLLDAHPKTLQVSKEITLGPGNYTVVATASNAGVTATATAKITIVPAVAPTIIITGMPKVMTTRVPVNYHFTVVIDGHGLSYSYKVMVDSDKVDSGQTTGTLHKIYTCTLSAGQHLITVVASNNYGYSAKKTFGVLVKVASITVTAPEEVDVPFLAHTAQVPISIQCSVKNMTMVFSACGVTKHLSGSSTIKLTIPVHLPEKAGVKTIRHIHISVKTPFGTFNKEITIQIKRADAFKVGAMVTFTVNINNGGTRLTDIHCNYAGKSYNPTTTSTNGNITSATFTVPAAKTGAVTICACNANGCDIKAFILPVAVPTLHVPAPSTPPSTMPSSSSGISKKGTGRIYLTITNKKDISGKKFVSATKLPISYRAYTTGNTYIHEIDIYVNGNHKETVPIGGNEKAYSGTYTLPLSDLPTYSTSKVLIVATSSDGHVAKDSVSFEVIPGKISVIITNTKVQPAKVNGKFVGWHVTLWYRITAEGTTLSSAEVWLNGAHLLESIPISGVSVVNSTTVMIFSNFVKNTKDSLSIIASGKDGSTGTATVYVNLVTPNANVPLNVGPSSVTVYAYDNPNSIDGIPYVMYFEYNWKWYYFGYYNPLESLIVIGPIHSANPPTNSLHKYVAGTYTFKKFGEGTFKVTQFIAKHGSPQYYRESPGYSVKITGIQTQPAPPSI